MFSTPIVLLGILLIVVIAVLRRAQCRRGPTRRYSVEWRGTIGRRDESPPLGADADGVICSNENCRHVNRPSASFCGRCGRSLTVNRAP